MPAYDLKLKKEDDQSLVFDIIRKKYIVLTPEEWVRQHFIHYLINELGYPKALINVEQGLRYNSLLKRSDIVVYSREGKPLVLVECKAARHSLNQKVVAQAVTYNKSVSARYIIITNGLESACMEIHFSKAKVDYLAEIPKYSDLKA